MDRSNHAAWKEQYTIVLLPNDCLKVYTCAFLIFIYFKPEFLSTCTAIAVQVVPIPTALTVGCLGLLKNIFPTLEL